jgi:hypothetical protein
MRKLIVTGMAVAMLAVPTAAMAAPGATGVSTNDNTKDAIGFCVSAGNYNYHQGLDPSGQTTTGQNRSALNAAGGPGAVADLIHGAKSACEEIQVPYAPPGQ